MDASNHSPSFRLAVLIAERVARECATETDPGSLIECLIDCGLEPEHAHALAWMEPVQLNGEELDLLSDALGLHRDLLGFMLAPASEEILEHVLVEIRDGWLNPECPECEEMAEQITAYAGNHGGVNQQELCLRLLEHLNTAPYSMEGEGFGSQSGDELVERLVEIVSQLPYSSRLHILAAAYKELDEATSGRPFGDLPALARLRSDHLTPFARQALDLLADAPGGELDEDALASSLDGAASARSLGQLQRSVRAAVESLARHGYSLAEEPLQLVRSRAGRRFRLGATTLPSWRALLAAESDLPEVHADDSDRRPGAGIP